MEMGSKTINQLDNFYEVVYESLLTKSLFSRLWPIIQRREEALRQPPSGLARKTGYEQSTGKSGASVPVIVVRRTVTLERRPRQADATIKLIVWP